MLLAKGKVIYFNEASLSVDYFSSINFKCPELSNPSDYFMSIMSIETIEAQVLDKNQGDDNDETNLQESMIEQYTKRIEMFHREYCNSNLKNDHEEVDKTVIPLS